MKKLLLLTFIVLACCVNTDAQDKRYAGTWKWHNELAAFNDDNTLSVWDYFIRIDIEDHNIYVRLKIVGNNVDGKNVQSRREGENVVVHDDGSISFDEYLSKNEYDNDDRLYWTVWTHYVVKYEGGRLNVTEKLMGEGRNRNGYLVKDERDISPIKHKIYYNEKDNW